MKPGGKLHGFTLDLRRDKWQLYEQINIAAPGVIVNPRPEQFYPGLGAKNLTDCIPDDLLSLFRKAHGYGR